MDTTTLNNKLINEKFLSILEECIDFNELDTIATIYAFLNKHLYDATCTPEQVFPTLNKFFVNHNLKPLSIESYHNKMPSDEQGKKESSETLVRHADMIAHLFTMFDKHDFDYNDVTSGLNQEELHIYLQNLNLDEYRNIITLILKEMLLPENEQRFNYLINLFLAVASIYTGDNDIGWESLFMFFTIVKSHIDNENIYQIIQSIEKVYIDIFFQYKQILSVSIDLEKRVSNNNIKLLGKTIVIDSIHMEQLSEYFKFNSIVWFSPVMNKNAGLDSRLDKLYELKDDYIKTLNNDFFSSPLLKVHYLKLILITKAIYSSTRDAFYISDCWRDNIDLEKMIANIEYHIVDVLKYDRLFVDNRVLSVLSAKNGLKMKYNSVNNKWDHKQMIEDMVDELNNLLKRMYFINDPNVIGKAIEEVSKIQDYCNQFNIYISYEKLYLRLMDIMNVVKQIQNITSQTLFRGVVDDYTVTDDSKAGDYLVRQSRNLSTYEIGIHNLSYVKFIGPKLALRKNVTSSNETSMKAVNEYWNYFTDYFGSNDDYDIYNNFNNISHI